MTESVKYIVSKIQQQPSVGIILGSGLGDFGKLVKDPIVIHTKDIKGYPQSTVEGHDGTLVFGTIQSNGKHSENLVVFQGRIHFYESSSLSHVIFPIEIAAELGIRTLIITNAAGGINRLFNAGDLMLIRDYINLTFENPLIGKSIKSSERIFNYFDEGLMNLAKTKAQQLSISLREGVYCWTKGPSYETASEIRMMQKLGADAVGMSTVPEVMTAVYLGMKVLGISCITNMATGISQNKLSHTEVSATANLVKDNFAKLIESIIISL